MIDVHKEIKRFDALVSDRIDIETTWEDCARYSMPEVPESLIGGRSLRLQTVRNLVNASMSERRSREVYDHTSLWAIDRLASGIESLTTPQSEKWHGLKMTDINTGKALDSGTVEAWLDDVTEFMFSRRYDPRVGFALANSRAIKSACALGTGVMFRRELLGTDGAVPFQFQYVPLTECYITQSETGKPNGLWRLYTMTAAQMVEKFGFDRVSSRVKQAVKDPAKKEDRFEILHVVKERHDRDRTMIGLRGAEFVSAYMELQQKHMLVESGFPRFPYYVYYWSQDDGAYGNSPIMLAMSEIKSLNIMSMEALVAAQQATNPPMALPDDSYTNRVDLSPRAQNPGFVDPATGRLLAQPIVSGQNLPFVQQIMGLKQGQLRETLYVNLWQILVEGKDTATAALIKNKEKAQLLGPIAARFQQTQHAIVEDDVAYLADQRLFDPQGVQEDGTPVNALAAPEEARDADVKPTASAPIDRLRRIEELEGIQSTLEMTGVIANLDPTIINKIDTNAVMEMTQEINGAPQRMFKTDEDFQAAVQAQQEAQAQQEQQLQLQQAAETAAKGVPVAREAAAQAQEAGLV